MLLDLVKEGLQKPYCNIICSVIIIAVSWEISLGLVINNNTSLVTNAFYFAYLMALKESTTWENPAIPVAKVLLTSVSIRAISAAS